MEFRPENHPAGGAAPAGFLRGASRWIVKHTGLVTFLTVLIVTALCVGQWWLSFRHAQDWDSLHRGEPVPFRLFSTAGWMVVIGAGSWFWLWIRSGRENKTLSILGKADWWRFDQRERQRIFEGRPMSRRLLRMHGLFGLVGVALGVALALRLAAAVGWQEEILGGDDGRIGIVVLAILVTAFAARRIRDVLFLQNFDYLVGDRAQELAQSITEEEQEQTEAEREYERKTITGWPYVVFMGGLIGGAFLAFHWLPDADGTTTFQGSVSGLIGSVSAVYLMKTKPPGWRIWLGGAVAFAGGFLVFTHETWHRSPLYLLLGTLWGIGVGVASTLLYLRDLPEKPNRPDD